MLTTEHGNLAQPNYRVRLSIFSRDQFRAFQQESSRIFVEEVAKKDLLRETERVQRLLRFAQEVDLCKTSISYPNSSRTSRSGKRARVAQGPGKPLAQFVYPLLVLLEKTLDKRKVGHLPASGPGDQHVSGSGQWLAALGVGWLSAQSCPSGRRFPGA